MPTKVEKINKDIAKERQTATFDVEELAVWWKGGKEILQESREIVAELAADSELLDKVPHFYLSYEDQYNNATRKSTILARKLMEIQERKDPGGESIFPKYIIGEIGSGFNPALTTLAVHFTMFVPAIEKQGTPEQIKKWLPRAKKCNILGTYAQTEMGHGTFVRGLQTRADYDVSTEEFILNSPSLTAYKWWPGGLGHSVNYAVVVAQLYIKGTNHGIQMFMVQLRDEETHMPMAGVTIGDIGNKMGFKGINNGFLGFKNVHIPRTNMLMKNSQVHPDGTFTSSPVSVLTYLTMLYVRVLLVKQSCVFLSQAATIATRYSAIRRQSVINPNEPEHQIMDHVTQQLKLFPEISRCIIFKIAADYLYEMYTTVTLEIGEGKLDRLAEIHALSSCLKAITTADSTLGVENLRLACGGHGYMLSSAFPDLYANASAAITYEGENTVMLLQTARFLMKTWSKALKGEKLVPTLSYLSNTAKMDKFPKWDGSLSCMVKALQFVSGNKIRLAYNHLAEKQNRGMSPGEAFNETSIELSQAAELYCRSFLATIAFEKLAVEPNNHSHKFNAVLQDLLELYLCTACWKNMTDILRFIHLSEEDLNGLQSKLEQSLKRIRPNAVTIVDGFEYHDRILNSVLGSYDGNAYERIFEEAQKNPLNKIPVPKSFHEYLKPFMRSNM